MKFLSKTFIPRKLSCPEQFLCAPTYSKFGKQTFSRQFNGFPIRLHMIIALVIFALDLIKIQIMSIRICKKTKKFAKHNESEKHLLSMTKWVNYKASEKANTPAIAQLNTSHMKKATETKKIHHHYSMFNIYSITKFNLRGHEESRIDMSAVSDFNRGNFFELLSLSFRDIP